MPQERPNHYGHLLDRKPDVWMNSLYFVTHYKATAHYVGDKLTRSNKLTLRDGRWVGIDDRLPDGEHAASAPSKQRRWVECPGKADTSPNYIVGLPRSPAFPTVAEAALRRRHRRDRLAARTSAGIAGIGAGIALAIDVRVGLAMVALGAAGFIAVTVSSFCKWGSDA